MNAAPPPRHGLAPSEAICPTRTGDAERGGGLRPITFSTAGLDPRHRFDAWCAEFSGINDILLPREDRVGFDASCTAWSLGAFTVASSRTPAMRMLRTRRHVARDGLDHWVLRVARRGVVQSRLGESRFETQARRLVLYSVADGFEGVWTAAEGVTLWIRRSAAPDLSAMLAARPPGLVEGAATGLLADLILSLPERLEAAAAAEAPALCEAIGGIISACLPQPGAPAPSAMREIWASASGNPLLHERVLRVVRENIASSRLTPDRIARAAGVSRTSLYRLMAAEGGVARFVQRVRLSLIHAALSDPTPPQRPIVALAEEYGFHDASAFSRAFRRTYGCTPSDIRAAALLTGRTAYGAAAGGCGGHSIPALLRHPGAGWAGAEKAPG